jgi:hypothetical protein
VGCHAECERYAAWKDEDERRKHGEKEAQKEKAVCMGYRTASKQRYKRRNGKK